MRGPTIGVDIGGTKILLMADWPDGRPPELLRLDTGLKTSPEELEHHITRFTASLGAEPEAVGIAVPGLIEADRIVCCDVLPLLDGWQHNNLLGAHIPHVFLHDIHAALAEEISSLPPGSSAAILVVGTGIGMAFTANGQVVSGACGWAGELGSIPMTTAEGVCRLDEIAGGAAVLARTDLDPEQVHTALAEGDPQVGEIIRQAGGAFGLAIATVVNLLNPEIVTLTGGTLTYPGYLTAALSTAEQTTLPHLWRACTIRCAPDEPLVALGAIRLAKQVHQVGTAENTAVTRGPNNASADADTTHKNEP